MKLQEEYKCGCLITVGDVCTLLTLCKIHAKKAGGRYSMARIERKGIVYSSLDAQ